MNKVMLVVGVVLLLLGALWAFQGLGIVGGSFMTRQRQWLVIGILTGVVGLSLLLWSNLRQP